MVCQGEKGPKTRRRDGAEVAHKVASALGRGPRKEVVGQGVSIAGGHASLKRTKQFNCGTR